MPSRIFAPSSILLLCAGLAAGVTACSSDSGTGPEPPPPPSAQWRWSAPVAEGVSLTDVWGPASDNLFATGLQGVVLRYDGASWKKTQTPTQEQLNALWGTSGTDVFAVGGSFSGGGNTGVILRFNGSAWTTAHSTDKVLVDVWGSSVNDVFAVGEVRTILHFDGADWTPMTVPSGSQALNSVWGSGPSDVYVTGLGKNLLHYDGVSWSEITTPATFALFAVWGTAWNDVFAVGGNGAAIHFDGVSWTPIDVGVSLFFKDLWGPSGNDVIAVGQNGFTYRWDGLAWTPLANRSIQDLESIFGVGGRTFAVGQYGTVLELTGNEWNAAPGAVTSKLEDVWMDSSGDAFAVGDYGTILRLVGGAWEPMASGTDHHLRAIHGTASNDLLAVGRGGVVLHFDGVSWTSSIEGPGFDLHDVWMFDTGEAYAVGAGGLVLHSLGAGWVDVSPGGSADSLLSVWGPATDDVRFVGAQSRSFKWNGTGWKLVTIDNARVNNYHSVFGTSADDIYVGAEFLRPATFAASASAPLHAGGLIYHWTGTSWEIPYQDPIHDVLSVWAAAPERAFASGDASSILTGITNGTFTRLNSFANLPFLVTSVWGTSATNVIVVGDNGTIVRYSR